MCSFRVAENRYVPKTESAAVQHGDDKITIPSGTDISPATAFRIITYTHDQCAVRSGRKQSEQHKGDYGQKAFHLSGIQEKTSKLVLKPLRISSANIANSTQSVDSVRCFDMQIVKKSNGYGSKRGKQQAVEQPLCKPHLPFSSYDCRNGVCRCYK